jgi:pterin-4a-carbinolamine dehydratase
MTDTRLDSGWKELQRPPSLTRSFQFDSYSELRRFLDELAELSEKAGYYPNLNFTRTQVNISIEGEGEQLADRDYNFARKTQSLATSNIA